MGGGWLNFESVFFKTFSKFKVGFQKLWLWGKMDFRKKYFGVSLENWRRRGGVSQNIFFGNWSSAVGFSVKNDSLYIGVPFYIASNFKNRSARKKILP